MFKPPWVSCSKIGRSAAAFEARTAPASCTNFQRQCVAAHGTWCSGTHQWGRWNP